MEALDECTCDISFYDYSCFEQLLLESPKVRSFNYNGKESVFDYITIERYYESKLKHATAGTGFPYDHKKGMSHHYLALSKKQLFDSAVGRVIYDALLKMMAF